MAVIEGVIAEAPRATFLDYGSEEEWVAARNEGIGSSEALAVLERPFTVWARKVGAAPEDDLSGVEYVQTGRRIEPFILEWWADDNRVDLAPIISGSRTSFVNKMRPFMRASLDGMTRDFEGQPAIIEVKNVGEWMASEWDEGAPTYPRVQVQHAMAVTGIPRAVIVALLGGNRLRWVIEEYNPKFAARLIAAEQELWEQVLAEQPPDVDDSEETARALAALYAEPDGSVVTLDASFADLADEYANIQEQLKVLEARKRGIQNTIKKEVGNATYAQLPDGSGWSLKKTERKAYEVAATSFRSLRRVKKIGGK